MVFGWGKKKSEKQEPEMAPQKKQILLSDVPNVVDEISSIRIKTIIAEAKTFKNKIEPSCETILHIAIDLERDTLNVNDIDIHLKRLVERGKKEVISIIKRESIVRLPEINSYDDVKNFNVVASRMLKKIGDALGRQSNVIHIFAKKYAGKLKSDLKIMTEGNDEITTIITNQAELENKTEKILGIISDIKQSRKLIDNLGDQEKQNNKVMDELVTKIEHDKEEIKNIKNSSEYTEFLHINEKLDSLSSEKNKIKSEIEHQFTKISRPLNKYVYVSSLDKPQKKLLVDLIENPFNALTLANKHDLVQILESVRKGVQSGSVSVKDITKSTSQIEEILSKLDSFIENVSNFDKSKTDLEDKLSIFDVKRLSQAENILKRHENEKSDFELKTKKLENEITDMIETLPKYRKSVMSILNEISAVQYSLKPE